MSDLHVVDDVEQAKATRTRRPADAPTKTELVRRMGYHPVVSPEQADAYEANRTKAIALANHFVRTTPVSREQSLALTALQEALMWANAAIACNSGAGSD